MFFVEKSRNYVFITCWGSFFGELISAGHSAELERYYSKTREFPLKNDEFWINDDVIKGPFESIDHDSQVSFDVEMQIFRQKMKILMRENEDSSMEKVRFF